MPHVGSTPGWLSFLIAGHARGRVLRYSCPQHISCVLITCRIKLAAELCTSSCVCLLVHTYTVGENSSRVKCTVAAGYGCTPPWHLKVSGGNNNVRSTLPFVGVSISHPRRCFRRQSIWDNSENKKYFFRSFPIGFNENKIQIRNQSANSHIHIRWVPGQRRALRGNQTPFSTLLHPEEPDIEHSLHRYTNIFTVV